MAAPKVGQIIDGYRFLGGNHKDPNSWQPAGVEEIAAAKTAGAAEGKMQDRGASSVNQNAFNEAANQLKDLRGIRKSTTGMMESPLGPFAANTGMIGAMEAGSDGLWKGLPGTPGYNLNKELGTVKARLMLANMQKMKNASPTGATGLGQMSNAEGDVLKSTVAPLDVGLPAGQLRQNLDRVREDVILNNPGVNIDAPVDLSQGQSRETIPRNAYYRDPQGNIRQNLNGDRGNPIVRPAQGRAQQAASTGPQNAFAAAKSSSGVRTYNPKTGALE